MTNEDKIKICIAALKYMGKILRECPPDLDALPQDIIPFEDYILMIAGGLDRDPQGLEYVNYFLNKAEKEVFKA